MNKLSGRLSLVLLALALPCASAAQTQRSVAPLGPATGLWELPELGASGLALGTLDAFVGGPPAYAFVAELIPWDLACPACIGGEIYGVLDDGVGPGPDFLVEGIYTGVLFGGAGTFRAQIKRPDGTRAGRILGSFADPLGQGSPGSFTGTYRIRP